MSDPVTVPRELLERCTVIAELVSGGTELSRNGWERLLCDLRAALAVSEQPSELIAEREEWNKFCGITHPPGPPPLSPKDARLMRAIFGADPELERDLSVESQQPESEEG